MVTTFVIGLREGLEAALVVGIIAAFIVRRDQRSALRSMWWGVALAIFLSAGGALGLHMANRALTLQARETLEGILTLVAVAGVTYMIIWMRRHSASLRTELESKAEAAFTSGSMTAVATLAFVAVAREGLETAVFLLALLDNTAEPVPGLAGAAAGIIVSIGLGYGIYRGGIAIDLGRFFRITGVVLIFVAAGLVMSAVHELAEAGVIGILQTPAIDLSWLITPNTVWSSLLTAFVGFQPVPTVAEVVAWAVFLIPMILYTTGVRLVRPRRRLAV